jgi:hypothetical protein
MFGSSLGAAALQAAPEEPRVRAVAAQSRSQIYAQSSVSEDRGSPPRRKWRAISSRPTSRRAFLSTTFRPSRLGGVSTCRCVWFRTLMTSEHRPGTRLRSTRHSADGEGCFWCAPLGTTTSLAGDAVAGDPRPARWHLMPSDPQLASRSVRLLGGASRIPNRGPGACCQSRRLPPQPPTLPSSHRSDAGAGTFPLVPRARTRCATSDAGLELLQSNQPHRRILEGLGDVHADLLSMSGLTCRLAANSCVSSRVSGPAMLPPTTSGRCSCRSG